MSTETKLTYSDTSSRRRPLPERKPLVRVREWLARHFLVTFMLFYLYGNLVGYYIARGIDNTGRALLIFVAGIIMSEASHWIRSDG